MKMNQKGDVPVPYIIALILGIIIVGVLGYGFFILGWQIPGITTANQCSVKAQTFCTVWARSNYASGNMPSGDWNTYAPECRTSGTVISSKSDCLALRGGGVLGSSCSDDTDCQTSLVCEGTCSGATGGSCTTNGDCTAPATCGSKVCR